MHRQAGVMSSSFASHIAKFEGLFPRLLLIFHVINCAEKKQYPTKEVSKETAEQTYKFMYDYLIHHSSHFHNDLLGESHMLKHVKWIAGHILSKDIKVLAKRDIKQAYAALRTVNDKEFKEIMNCLESMGWLLPDLGARQGQDRIPSRWVINPDTHNMFKEIAQKERDDRLKIREAILEIKKRASLQQPQQMDEN